MSLAVADSACRTLKLPASVDGKLVRLRRRVRSLSLAAGAALTLLVLLAIAAAAMAADWLWILPDWTRWLLWGAWVATAVGLLARCVLRPAWRRLDRQALAACVERTYPVLGEVLTTSVNLALVPDPFGHMGSAALKAAVIDQAARRTAALDFRRTYPSRTARRRLLLLALVLLAAVAVAGRWFSEVSRLSLRFVAPWANLARVSRTELHVEPGDRVVARHDSVTIRARVARTPHPEAWLRWQDAAGLRHEVKMTADASADLNAAASGPAFRHFFFTLPHLTQDVTYQVQADDALSRRYRLTVVDAPAVTGRRIEIVPPEYTGRPAQTLTSPAGDVRAFEGSKVALELEFNKPVAEAVVEAPGGRRLPASDRSLSLDRRRARVALPTDVSGIYRVHLRDEHGLTNRQPLEHVLEIERDQAPRVELAGREPRDRSTDETLVPPTEKVPVEVQAADDLQVADLQLQARIGRGPWQPVPLETRGVGTPEAQGQARLDLQKLGARPGDVVLYRAVARDNRPDPHVVESKPRVLKVADGVDSLHKQAQQAGRLPLREQLADIRRQVVRDRAQAQHLAKPLPPPRADAPSPDRQEAIRALADQQDHTADRLRQFARDVSNHEALWPLAPPSRALADQDLAQLRQDFEKAAAEPEPSPQVHFLRQADQHAAAIDQKLADLEQRFDELGKAQDIQADLQRLARRQKELAAAAESPKTPPTVAPEQPPADLERLAQEQDALALQGREAAADDPQLRRAVQVAAAQRADELASRLQELAQRQQQLAARSASDAAAEKAQLQHLAREQERLALQAGRLDEETRAPLTWARLQPLETEPLREAVDALRQGDARAALAHQDRAVRELQRGAEAIGRTAARQADPPQAGPMAQMLAERQRQLARQVAALTPALAGKPEAEARALLAEAAAEQARLAEAADQLDLPDSARPIRHEASRALQKALDDLVAPAPAKAKASQRQAAQALDRLAQAIRPEAVRRLPDPVLARELAARQEEVADHAERLAAEKLPEEPGQSSQKMAELQQKQDLLADQQERLIRAAQRIAAPEARAARDAVLEKMQAAAEALAAKSRHEAAPVARQAATALRDLADQLARQAHSPKAQAQRLADLQRQLADQVQKADAAARSVPPAQLQPWLQAVRQKARQSQAEINLNADRIEAATPEAAQAKAEAAKQLDAALAAVHDKPLAEVARAEQEAAIGLEQLANRLAGRPDPSRAGPEGAKREAELARRLAQAQRELQKQAQALADGQKAKPAPDASSPTPASDLARLADEQKRIAGQTAVMPAQAAPAEKREAVDRLDRSFQAMKAGRPAEAADRAQEAVRALDRLAEKLQERAGRPPRDRVFREQAAQAAHLAQAQKDLRDKLAAALQPSPPVGRDQPAAGNPLEPLARRQQELAGQTKALADHLAAAPAEAKAVKPQAEAASAASHKAADALAKGDPDTARSALDTAAAALRQAAPPLQAAAKAAEQAPPSADKPAAPELQPKTLAAEADRLADAHAQMRQALDSYAVRGALHQARQQEVLPEADRLVRQAQRLAQAVPQPHAEVKEIGRHMADLGAQAREEMHKAVEAFGQPRLDQGAQAQQRSVQALQQALARAAQLGQAIRRRLAPPEPSPVKPEPAQQVAEALAAMDQAAVRLQAGEKPTAQMQAAADKLNEAARKLLEPMPPPTGAAADPRQGAPPGQGPSAGPPPAGPAAAPDPRAWGELPGYLKTQIMKALAGRYSAQYQELIKRYFEQIAKRAELRRDEPRRQE